MQYNTSTKKFSIVDYPKTAMGTKPEVDKTIAVDPYYVPRKSVSAGLVKVKISSVGDRQAEDGGGAITGFKIDVFYGTGLPKKIHLGVQPIGQYIIMEIIYGNHCF